MSTGAIQERFSACSRAQEAVWLAEQVSDIDAANNLAVAIALDGPLSVPRLAQSMTSVVRSQPALRTRYDDHRGRLVRMEVPPEELPATRLTAEAVTDVASAVEDESRWPIDLLRGSFRQRLLQTADDRHVLLSVFHHATFDGLSEDIFLDGLAEAYGSNGTASTPQPSFGEYVALERELLNSDDRSVGEFWTSEFSAIQGAARQLATSDDVTPDDAPRGDAVRFTVDPELRRRLDAVARENDVSLFVLLLACVHLVYHGHAAPESDTVATLIPLGTRPAHMRRTIGLFTNEIAFWTAPGRHRSLHSYLAHVGERFRSVLRVRLYPYNEAVARFGPHRDPRTVAPGLAVGYWKSDERDPVVGPLRMTADRLLPLFGRRWQIGLRFVEGSVSLRGVCEYDAEVLRAVTARALVDQLLELLTQVSSGHDHPLASLRPR
jgi:hypothetical protein